LFLNNFKTDDNVTTIYYTNKKGKSFEILIDAEDLDKIIEFNYSIICRYVKESGYYYAFISEYTKLIDAKHNTKIHRLHRFIMDYPKGFDIDHKNHNTLDNRKENLRIVRRGDNDKHRISKNKNNKSGYRNVFWNKQSNKWEVHLQVNGINKCLGRFDDVHEAGEYAKIKRKEIYKEFAGNN